MKKPSYRNDDTVSIHVTDRCNMKCPGCYQLAYNDIMDKDAVYEAVDKLNPKNLIMYGGESMLFPDLIEGFMDDFPDKNIILATNGTIWRPDLFDRAYMIMTTVESFFFMKSKNRLYTRPQWDNLMKLIDNYKHKLSITHNIYPTDNDTTFFSALKLSGYDVKFSYPMVCYEGKEACEIDMDILRSMCVNMEVLTKPKLRILPDGTITKDMRGIYNICKAKDWKEEYRDLEVPVHDKCKQCKYYGKCPACNMFPHFCKDVLDTIAEPHFCEFTRQMHNMMSKEV